MVLWPTVSLVGFLLLTGLVISMGTRSTARYEAEKQQTAVPRVRNAGTEAIGATAVL